MSDDPAKLSIWTVYEHLAAFPNSYVARRFETDASGARPTDNFIISLDLESLRKMLLADGLTVIPRSEGDDPKIIESWI